MIDPRVGLFVPSRAIYLLMEPLNTGFDGDNRDFSFDAGTSRAEISVDVDHSPFGQTFIAAEKTEAFGQTARYSIDKIADVPGKPFFWKAVRRVPFLDIEVEADARATAPVSADTLAVSAKATADAFSLLSFVVVSLHVKDTNPLEPLAPPFYLTLDVKISRTGLPGYTYSLTGSHDAFPAYELYLALRIVYKPDPVSFGSSPLSLFEQGGIIVNVPPTVMF